MSENKLTNKIKESIKTLITHSQLDMGRENGTYRKLHLKEMDEKAIRKSQNAIKFLEELIF